MVVAIAINITNQCLSVMRDNKKIKTFTISSGLNGPGCEKNSGKTPLGLHTVRAKIGGDQPQYTVFVGRRPTGEVYNESLGLAHPNRDWILSRIIWLSGCEKGHNRLGNVDTMQRYIYIHGTPDTEPMGVPISHGCIRMRNDDVIELFNLVSAGSVVTIFA